MLTHDGVGQGGILDRALARGELKHVLLWHAVRDEPGLEVPGVRAVCGVEMLPKEEPSTAYPTRSIIQRLSGPASCAVTGWRSQQRESVV